jgi:hypothetical protein
VSLGAPPLGDTVDEASPGAGASDAARAGWYGVGSAALASACSGSTALASALGAVDASDELVGKGSGHGSWAQVFLNRGVSSGSGSGGAGVTRANRPSDSGWPNTRRIVKGREPLISAAMVTADSLMQRSCRRTIAASCAGSRLSNRTGTVVCSPVGIDPHQVKQLAYSGIGWDSGPLHRHGDLDVDVPIGIARPKRDVFVLQGVDC